ncbi:hypothetical protein ACFW04_010265 [Cataglyphis niger]
MEFTGGLSPCRARFGNLYFYVVPVAIRRAHILGGAGATLRRPVFFLFFFFAPPDHDLRDILFIQIFSFLSIERLEIEDRRSYSDQNPITRSYLAFSGHFREGGKPVVRRARVNSCSGTSQIAFTVRLRCNHLCNEMPEYAEKLWETPEMTLLLEVTLSPR